MARKRPKFGAFVKAKDQAVRRNVPGTLRRVWIRYGEQPAAPGSKPLSGAYIGYRTFYDGTVYYGSHDEPTYFVPTSHREFWLIVPGERMNPVPVFPEDVEWEEE